MTAGALPPRELTRLSGLPAWAARLALAAFLALATYGFVLGFAPPVASDRFLASDVEQGDGALYRAVVARMATGAGYYEAAVAEHRARRYPLRPFVTVRPPLLAAILSRSGLETGRLVLAALLLAAAAAVSVRLFGTSRSPPVQVAGTVMAAVSAAMLLEPTLVVWHEVWAAALIALSLAARRERRWAASVALGLAAVAIRELALPYLAVMACAAMLDGRRREAGAWAAATAAALVIVGAHALAVGAHVGATDIASPGWHAAEGWRLPLLMIAQTGPLIVAPAPLVGVIVPLALLGWAAWPAPVGLRGAMLLSGYAAAFCVLGRVNNVYWGLMFAPLLLVGLAWAPSALRDLAGAALPRPSRAVAA